MPSKAIFLLKFLNSFVNGVLHTQTKLNLSNLDAFFHFLQSPGKQFQTNFLNFSFSCKRIEHRFSAWSTNFESLVPNRLNCGPLCVRQDYVMAPHAVFYGKKVFRMTKHRINCLSYIYSHIKPTHKHSPKRIFTTCTQHWMCLHNTHTFEKFSAKVSCISVHRVALWWLTFNSEMYSNSNKNFLNITLMCNHYGDWLHVFGRFSTLPIVQRL